MISNSEKVFDGNCISFWDNKNKKNVKVFVKGMLREEQEYYQNGNLKDSLVYNESGGDKIKLYGYNNGKPQLKETFEGGVLMTLEEWYENGNKSLIHQFTREEYQAISLDGWYDDGKVSYHIESKSDKPMELKSSHTFQRTEDDFNVILNEIKYIYYGKGKSFYKNGEWMTELFYEGEKTIKVKYPIYHNVGNPDDLLINKPVGFDTVKGSIKCVSKLGLGFYNKINSPIPYNSYIRFVDFYKDPQNILQSKEISGEDTTLFEYLNNGKVL
jgi:antitoxin component YwqK of YwqJK toxin-antitoxin module